MPQSILYAVAAAIAGLGVGFALRNFLLQKSQKNLESKQKELLFKAKSEALEIKEKAKADQEHRQKFLDDLEKSLRKREEMFDKRMTEIEEERKSIKEEEGKIGKIKEEVETLKKEETKKLEQVARLKREEAKELLLKSVEKDFKDDIIKKIRQTREETKEAAEIEARKILSTVIQRLAGEHTTEHTTMAVTLPSEEMKGRIIGKEGRNIQIFEKLTGVDLVVDETPDTVLISAFDPVRRHIAKRALEYLIADGRIHPTRIEDMVKKAEGEIKKEMKEAGEEAVEELGISGFHPDLIRIIGSLTFRTSYGQNVLRHSIEVGHVAAMLAQELGADVSICKKAALLHDVGKAVSHEVPGAHHHISGEIARKYGLSEAVIHTAMAHHDDIEPKTVEALVIKAADAISGVRPGARRESAESYIKRLTELENITNSFPGVDKSYAIQAGREIRIIVKPEEIDDLEAIKLSKDIARKIESSLQYPGTIKVNVIRETRAVEYAK